MSPIGSNSATASDPTPSLSHADVQGVPSAVGPTWEPGREGVDLLARLEATIGSAVVGYSDAVRALAIALLANGHVLLEGVPGLAKTYLVRTFSNALDLTFRRIQFTPDMLPTDILGVTVLHPVDQRFEFRPGPVFANVVLADEINRAPPKVQSALLEAMQEGQVTVDGRPYALPSPFMVIATENPIEQEGTYPLPEAELDRFLFRWVLSYPSHAEEMTILTSRDRVDAAGPPAPVVPATEVEHLRRAVREVYVSPELIAYLTRVVRETRQDPRVVLGASPRASVQFLFAARAAALLDGRRYVIPDDIRSLAFGALNHRIFARPEALLQDANTQGGTPGVHGRLRRLLRDELDRIEVPR
ncbi:MAG: MoxR family ATPase [Thermoplasmata archaeon]